MEKENKPEWAEAYDFFMNEEFRKLKDHAMRCFQRCHNKLLQLSHEGSNTHNEK